MYKGYLDGLLIVEGNSIPYIKERLDEENKIFGWHCVGVITRGRKVIRVKDYIPSEINKQQKWLTCGYNYSK